MEFKKYPKINGLYKRLQKDDYIPNGMKKGDFIVGSFAKPEFKYLYENKWVWSEKLDGMNMRILVDTKSELIAFAGKTDNAQIPVELTTWLQQWIDKHDDQLFKIFPEGAILYGEGVGNKIQSGGNFGKQHFKLFDVLVGDFWLEKPIIDDIASVLDLDSVKWFISDIDFAIKELQTKPKSSFGEFTIEGYVGEPLYRLKFANGARIQTKIKIVDFCK